MATRFSARYSLIEKVILSLGTAVFVFLVAFCVWAFLIQPWIATKPIHKAARRGDLNEVQRLVESGTPIDLPGPLYLTPVEIAFDEHKLPVAKYLIEKGADVRRSFWRALSTRDIEMVKAVVSRGARIERDALLEYVHWGGALYYGTELLDYLLKSGRADIEARLPKGDYKGWTALHVAVRNREFDVVEYLVGKGADVNSNTPDSRTPLQLAERGYRIKGGTGPGIHTYRDVPPSPEIAAFLREKGAYR
jgi:hypothetical protein